MSFHSIDDDMCGLAITVRCAAKASQMITINIIKATNEMIAPIEEITFQLIIASG
jgi:hypothetical protein